MNTHIQSIYSSGRVTGQTGTVHELHSSIDPEEGEFIHGIIAGDASITKTLEVGCAYGLSALHICEATRARPSPQHTIIDPFQKTQWDGVGITNLKNAGIDFFTLVEKRSEFALPELLQAGEGVFDFIFVDGWHTFDHTLIDCFYATRLLRVGGYLVIDDVMLPPVGRCVDYLLRYPCYTQAAVLGWKSPQNLKLRVARAVLGPVPADYRRKVFHPKLLHEALEERQAGMVALKKIAPDERSWDWYADF